MRYFLLIFMMLAATTTVQAEEAAAPKAATIAECKTQFEAVQDDLRAARSCWVDADCVAANFGCPWQQAGCDHTIISLEDQTVLDTIVGKMAGYQAQCVLASPSLSARCEAQDAAFSQLKCPQPSLKCLNGTCVTQTQVLLQDDLVNDY